MRRKQPRIDPVMAGNHLINLFQRDRPPRQIKILILPAAAPPLLNLLLGSIDELGSADRVRAYRCTLQRRRWCANCTRNRWRSSPQWKMSARPLPRLGT
jgi:hypothetical protein